MTAMYASVCQWLQGKSLTFCIICQTMAGISRICM
jgi:hypothetical protein